MLLDLVKLGSIFQQPLPINFGNVSDVCLFSCLCDLMKDDPVGLSILHY